MGIRGQVVLHNNVGVDAAAAAINAFYNLTRFESWGDMWRYEKPGKRMDARTSEGVRSVFAPTEAETLLGWEMPYADGLREFKAATKLAVSGFAKKVGGTIDQECRALIDESVRDSFIPSSPRFVVGPHHLAELLGDYQYFGLATFSMQFFGWGAPSDWFLFQKAFVELPTVSRVLAAVERHVGPLQVCMCFDG